MNRSLYFPSSLLWAGSLMLFFQGLLLCLMCLSKVRVPVLHLSKGEMRPGQGVPAFRKKGVGEGMWPFFSHTILCDMVRASASSRHPHDSCWKGSNEANSIALATGAPQVESEWCWQPLRLSVGYSVPLMVMLICRDIGFNYVTHYVKRPLVE